MTPENADDLTKAINDLGDPDISATGTIRYDYDKKTLTMEDATVTMNKFTEPVVSNGISTIIWGMYFATNGVHDLHWDIYGDCKLENPFYETPGVTIGETTTINVHDGGSLYIKSGQYGLTLLAQLDLQGGNITIESDPARGYAINSPTDSPFYLFHEKGTLSLLGSVLDLYQMNLINNTEIVSPEGAYYDAERGRIFNSRGNVEKQEWIVIATNTTPTDIVDIEHSKLNIEHSPAVYDLQGRKVNNGYCKGIYIINGKKYINY